MNIIFKILDYLKRRKSIIIHILMIAAIVVSTIFGISSCYHKSQELLEIEKKYEELESNNAELDKIVEQQTTDINSYKMSVKELEAKTNALQKENQELKKKLVNETSYPDPEYIQSTYVWNSLKSLGLNDYVCAGILGNIMTEVGGQTLDISKYSMRESKTCYGICQWTGDRRTRMLRDYGKSLTDQVSFLSVELFEVIPKDSSFYSMQDEKKAALYFAQYYERCGSGSYSVRKANATKALDYFTGK